MSNENLETYWNSTIKEYEVDPTWKDHPIYKDKSYRDYRSNWMKAELGKYLGDFCGNSSVSSHS